MPGRPERIISLVPSQTELLYDLGAGDRVAGITRFCVHPREWFLTKPRVGGTKKINFEKIASLRPDLILANKEENQKEQILELMKHYRVWMSDIKSLDDALKMISSVGDLIDETEKARLLCSKIREEFVKLKVFVGTRSGSTGVARDMGAAGNGPGADRAGGLKTAYVIWNNPLMFAGEDTFINAMMERCGLLNCFGSSSASRYPEMSMDQLALLKPELILLSSEPFPFKEKHIRDFQQACPEALVRLVDGELFSWYGSRLVKSPAYFMELIGSLTGS